jgi:hypothetical protein
MDCVITPDGYMLGQNVAVGTLFAPNATVTLQNFPWPDYFYLDINQPSGSPPITNGGVIAAAALLADSVGSARLDCAVYISDAAGNYTQVTFAPLTFSVQP